MVERDMEGQIPPKGKTFHVVFDQKKGPHVG
jgi:hypothetical protein